jgi:hypothetical protein
MPVYGYVRTARPNTNNAAEQELAIMRYAERFHVAIDGCTRNRRLRHESAEGATRRSS